MKSFEFTLPWFITRTRHVIVAPGCTGEVLSTTFTRARSYSTSPATSSKSLSSSSFAGVSSVMSLWFTTRSFGGVPEPAPLSEPVVVSGTESSSSTFKIGRAHV